MAAAPTPPPAPASEQYGVGGSLYDLVSTLKGVVNNLSELIKSNGTLTLSLGTAIGRLATATLGGNLGGTTNPTATVVTNIGTASALVIAANSARLGITFHSPAPAAVDMWVVPQAITAVAGRGIRIVAGDRFTCPSTCGWNAIATTGSANVLTILEFV